MLLTHFGQHELERDLLASARSVDVQSRMDQHLAERIGRALKAKGYPALRTVEVSVEGRCVVLQGRVTSYYMKQIAQAVTLAVPGVQQLCNDVEAIPPAALVSHVSPAVLSFSTGGSS